MRVIRVNFVCVVCAMCVCVCVCVCVCSVPANADKPSHALALQRSRQDGECLNPSATPPPPPTPITPQPTHQTRRPPCPLRHWACAARRRRQQLRPRATTMTKKATWVPGLHACLHSSVVFSFLFPCSFLLFSTVGIIVYLYFLGDVQSDLFCYLFGQNPINIYIYATPHPHFLMKMIFLSPRPHVPPSRCSVAAYRLSQFLQA